MLAIYYIIYYNAFGHVDMIQYSGLHLFFKSEYYIIGNIISVRLITNLFL